MLRDVTNGPQACTRDAEGGDALPVPIQIPAALATSNSAASHGKRPRLRTMRQLFALSVSVRLPAMLSKRVTRGCPEP